MVFSVLRTALLLVMLALHPWSPVQACAFHFNTELPKASLFQQIVSSTSLVAARPTALDPFRFGETQLLKGVAVTSAPPYLVDSVTRRHLAVASERAVLFSQDADGIWGRLLLLDETTKPIVTHMLAQRDRWGVPGGAADRRDFAARLLAHPDPRLRDIGLRELDTIDYRTLRAGTYDVSAEQLLQGIYDLQSQAYAPVRILLLGIVGGELAEATIARQLRDRIVSDTGTNLGAWTTASLEVNGKAAFADFDDILSDRDHPLTRSQTDEIVRALAVQSASGAPAVRGPARLELFRFMSHYPDVTFVARAQALVASIFTGAMTDMKSDAPAASSLFALLIAFIYGAVHTFGPGHGKAVVISHFVGTGGSFKKGVLMGTQIAIVHVLSAVVLVFLFDFTVRQATGSAPSDFRLIRLASYAIIAVIGAVMLWRAVQALVQFRRHDHRHHHHHHAGGCASCDAAAKQVDKGAGWLAAAIGVVPCTGALLIMLYGLANNLVGPAIAMVVAISLGMAIAMTTLGVLAIWGHNWAGARLMSNATHKLRFEIGARLVGATIVFLIGAMLFVFTVHSPVPSVAEPPFSTVATDDRAPNQTRTKLY